MFLAHIPAGYLLTKALVRRDRPDYRRLMATGLVASVLPDFDLFYHYLGDGGAHEHHNYITHTPVFWLVLSLLAAVVLLVARRRDLLIYLAVVLSGVLLHLILDSVASGIMWLYPWSTAKLNLVPVPALYHPWVLNFVLHWTFGLELLIVAIAAAVFISTRRRSRAVSP
jgi:inner membrane protein